MKIVTQGNKRVWDGNGYLLISNFDESMAGQYNCRAENVLGTTDSEQVKVDLTRQKCKSLSKLECLFSGFELRNHETLLLS